MKTRIFFAAFIAVSFVVTSACDVEGIHHDYMVQYYYIYITGDTDRTVQISYLERGLVKNPAGRGQVSLPDGTIPEYVGGGYNVITTEAVTLPFLKEIYYVENQENTFFEIASTNDSTTKAIMFQYDVVLADTFCKVVYALNTSYGMPDECAYCKSLSTDSVLSYLKAVKYPCYIEFSQGDTQKRVSLSDVEKWERETGLYFDNTKH